MVFFYGFFATFFGSIGYILAMQYLPTSVCLNAFLLEPYIAQVLGCLFGIDLMPGFMTIIGTALLTLALLMINRGTLLMVKDKKRPVEEILTVVPQATEDLEKL